MSWAGQLALHVCLENCIERLSTTLGANCERATIVLFITIPNEDEIRGAVVTAGYNEYEKWLTALVQN